MLRDRTARTKLDFFTHGRVLASILVDSARSRTLPGVLSGVSGRPWRLSGRSWGAPGTPRDAPETLPRRLRDALGRHGASREASGTDFASILGAPSRSRDRFCIDFRVDFQVDFRTNFANELASEWHTSRLSALALRSKKLDDTTTRLSGRVCKAKKLDRERATDIAHGSSLLDVSERVRNRNTHTSRP